MRVGIKKLQENEWLVHIGPAAVKLDQFSVALLNITLEHLLALEQGGSQSTLTSYVKLGLKMKELKPLDLQKLLRQLDNKDLAILLLAAEDSALTEMVLTNSGAILSKQIELDLHTTSMPEDEEAKNAIRQIVETMFELEGQGQIEFVNENTRYI